MYLLTFFVGKEYFNVYISKYFVTLSSCNSTNWCNTVFHPLVPLLHFFSKSFIRKNSPFINVSLFGKELLPLVTC